MSASTRIRRPKLERTGPIRSWSSRFEAQTRQGTQAPPTPGAPAGGPPGPDLGDVVSRSVDLGYRVVDEYIRRGQRAAQRLSERSYDVQAMTSDLQDVAMRTLQFASEFARVWLDPMRRAATEVAPPGPPPTPGAPPTPSAPPTPGTPTGETTRAQSVRVKIEVTSTQPTDVTLDLGADAPGLQLIVHALRAVDPEKPRLTEVGFRAASDDQPPTLRIVVPADQPPGVYSGLIVDEESSRPVGSVSVRVAATA